MKSHPNTKQLFLTLVVLFILLFSKQIIACDSHDIAKLPLKPCPICAVSGAQSFIDHTFEDISVYNGNNYIFIQPRVLISSFHAYVCLFPHKNRAPPQSTTV